MQPSLDVIAIGNAIVDVLGKADDPFLERHGMVKGGMVLIDDKTAGWITEALTADARIAGGSAGNTIATLAALGGKGSFVGTVADDELGQVYARSMEATGARFPVPPIEGAPTGRCLIAVTPDAERSMATFLGAAGMVAKEHLPEEEVRAAKVTYFEGYLFFSPVAQEAFVRACELAHEEGRMTALTLSDVGVVENCRDALFDIIDKHVDLVFANENEAQALFGTHEGPEDLAAAMAKIVAHGAVTLSERGSLVFGPDHKVELVPAFTPDRLVDTTGAGDAYAGGFLYGLTNGLGLDRCAALGSLCATEVISHFGARPEADLVALAKEKGLI